MTRKLGYLRDPPDEHDLDLAGLSLPTSDLPAKASLRSFVREVLDQGTASSCVAHAFAAGIVIAEEHAGVSLDLPSRCFIYWNSRKQHSFGIMRDDGTYLRTCAAALQKLGAPDERFWPYKTNVIGLNRRPNFNAYMRAHARRGGEYRRIFGGPEERELGIRAAVAAGLPVAFGTRVDDAFTRESGELVVGPPRGATIGGHAMLIIGYDRERQTYEVLNSWGRAWRNAGVADLTAEYIRWEWTSDLWVIRGWEAIRAEV